MIKGKLTLPLNTDCSSLHRWQSDARHTKHRHGLQIYLATCSRNELPIHRLQRLCVPLGALLVQHSSACKLLAVSCMRAPPT